jgi:HNH endonuclease
MNDYVRQLADTVIALRDRPARFPNVEEEAAKHAHLIALLRIVWGALPNYRVKDSSKESYMATLLGHEPSESHLALAFRTQRRRRLTEDERVELECAQGGRCALCGTLFAGKTSAQVDHILPVSLGGADELANFQLLCGRCNIGKSNSLHWLMLMPFFDESAGNEPSATLRYAVLQRFAGRCSVEGCDRCSTDGDMHVFPFVPVSEGGRIIFDNLGVFCSDHFNEMIEIQNRRARAQLRSQQSPGFKGFGFNR